MREKSRSLIAWLLFNHVYNLFTTLRLGGMRRANEAESQGEVVSVSADHTEVNHFRALMEQETAVGFAYFSSDQEYYLGFLKFIAGRADIRGKVYGPMLLQDSNSAAASGPILRPSFEYAPRWVMHKAPEKICDELVEKLV